MSFLTAVYRLVIGPLDLLFDVIFSLANTRIHNPGLAIIFLSIAMNIIVLPLYKRADEMQAKQGLIEKELAPWVKKIKKTFRGDEQYMILQTFYRQNNYKPTDSLKGSVSLLLQIPFFIAAYRFLSGLELLKGVSFGPITDLSAPDAMLTVAGITINLLPIIMTIVNVVSGAIYTKDMSVKSKVQLYVMALAFLVLLYRSPAGLVFYWTLNNVFSLIKNIFYKLKNPKKILSVLASVAGVALLAVALFVRPVTGPFKWCAIIILFIVLELPLLSRIRKPGMPGFLKESIERKPDKKIFLLGTVWLTLLLGGIITSILVKSSPEEFYSLQTMTNPLLFVASAFLLSAGTFLIWFRVFYVLFSDKAKCIMEYVVWILAVVATVDFMAFGTELGSMSNLLVYEEKFSFSMKEKLLNLLVVLVVAAIAYLLLYKKKNIVSLLCTAAAIGMVIIVGMNVYNINTVVSESRAKIEKEEGAVNLKFSKNGQNVLVFMVDRAISKYVPYIFNEKPEVAEKFEDFTYYPNTISFGTHTIFGSPGLYGGYEYIPSESNKRDNMTNLEKHNEALTMLPRLFSENGFTATTCDPPLAGWQWVPDLSIYNDYPDINACVATKFVGRDKDTMASDNMSILNKKMFCYSVFKAAPLAFSRILYDEGQYNLCETTAESTQTLTGLNKAKGMSEDFMNNYVVMESLTDLSTIEDNEKGSLVMICTEETHSKTLLQEPDYTPALSVDNSEYEPADKIVKEDKDGNKITMTTEKQIMHYHVDVAAFTQIGNWIDWMKKEGIYDNTRIILVSDHGYSIGLNPEDVNTNINGLKLDMMYVDALLMVKDFNASGFKTDTTFMTNADVPTLATEGVIDNPTNPFTGKAINSDKKKGTMYIYCSHKSKRNLNQGNTFTDNKWVEVTDKLFENKVWKPVKSPKN